MSDADWGFALEHEEITILGNREMWGGQKPFGILRTDRRQHFYVIGKSGAGKTTLLRNVILEDIEAGHGVSCHDRAQ
jgi:ABC-type Fe3+/spermidine/putrescine transport system ATPase subunit